MMPAHADRWGNTFALVLADDPFSPRLMIARMLANHYLNRKSKLSFGNRAGNNQREYADNYDTKAYHCAIKTACKRAGMNRAWRIQVGTRPPPSFAKHLELNAPKRLLDMHASTRLKSTLRRVVSAGFKSLKRLIRFRVLELARGE